MSTAHKSGFGWIIGGFLLLGVSNFVELRGDIAPVAMSGVSGERLFYHLLALLVLLGGLACFVRGGILAYRKIAARSASPDADAARVFADEPEPAFDADAVLARYLARKQDQSSDQPPGAPQPQSLAPRGGFGRKGV